MQHDTVSGFPPLVDAIWLQDRFREYANPKSMVARLVRSGWLIRLRRGLYMNAQCQNDPDVRCAAANRIYGPSYVSFSYALRYHGIIPEAVPNVTSATYRKRRTKRYDTPLGSYLYRDVPVAVYDRGVSIVRAGFVPFLIASPVKALLDELGTIPAIRSQRLLREMLFENLRVDEQMLSTLSFDDALSWASTYRSDTVQAFLRFVGSGGKP